MSPVNTPGHSNPGHHNPGHASPGRAAGGAAREGGAEGGAPRRRRGGRGRGNGGQGGFQGGGQGGSTTGAAQGRATSSRSLAPGSLAPGAPPVGSAQAATSLPPAQRSAQVPTTPAAAPSTSAPVIPATPAIPATAQVAGTGASFAELGVPAPLVAALEARGVTSPFPIQAATLPDTLAGRDVLGRGRTGSGKTIAFALPLVARVAAGPAPRSPRRPRGLVLAPTRELATQIAATVEPLAEAAGLRTTVIFGGVPQGRQVSALAAGVDLLIACPGRLEDLLRQRELTLDGVEVTVLDEADHMADLGFLPGVKRLLEATPRGGQRLLFSATLDNGVDVIVKRFLVNPLTHSVDSAAAPPPAMTHHALHVADAGAKTDVVQHLASGTGRRVLFLRTKHQAKKLAKQLTAAGIPAVDLHGNLSQNARVRNLDAFTSGEVKVMVATDIAARGIHVDDVELVVHVDPPTEHKAYLHRSGRTARAGSGGDVVTVVLPEQAREVAQMMRQARVSAEQHQRTTAASPVVIELTGEVAPHVEPAPPAPPAAPARSGAPRSSGASRNGANGGNGGGARRGGGRSRGAAGTGGGSRRGGQERLTSYR
ncbi:Superfamily II DNA and RNA helicase [Quadrisphaera granulorum]|uniref:Superfamily II DNA/RNA helicase n=1 Tax=Quadrisphaera granulorum TaxID=317664 RepID=A0A316AEL1_9ACTN|nr:DEAD/DEAH box helicase [Quadrisphaera granulorum]PWJ55799.1 superfamily II DNA/RNA helicase [Quadrisphaera granulorum]SZE95296.1 Superfamily II DNA and RNA helicase [Quadrisphaera granulorum]